MTIGDLPVRAGVSGPPVLCVGALTFDLTLHLGSLPVAPGKYPAHSAAVSAAGMATSAATAVVRLGRAVDLWATAGEDMIGDFLIGELQREGIGIGHVRCGADGRSAVSAILVDGEGERIAVPYYDRVLMATIDPVPDFSAYAGVLADVRWPAAAAAALAGARDAGRPAVLDLDVGPREVLSALAPLATHIVASQGGAAVLSDERDPADAASWLMRTYGVVSLVTAGSDGVRWVEAAGGPARSMPAFAVTAVDTNAAGDIFHGAFVAEIVAGRALDDAILTASAAAACKCRRAGGRLGAPTRAELDAFLAEHRLP